MSISSVRSIDRIEGLGDDSDVDVVVGFISNISSANIINQPLLSFMTWIVVVIKFLDMEWSKAGTIPAARSPFNVKY